MMAEPKQSPAAAGPRRLSLIHGTLFALCFAFPATIAAQPRTAQHDFTRLVKGAAVGQAVYWIGNAAESWSSPTRHVFAGPILLDRFVRNALLDDSRKQNFLDHNGVQISAVGGAAVVALANLEGQWEWRQAVYDVVAFASGMALTGGVTRFTKGLFSRPRPYVDFNNPLYRDEIERQDADNYRSFVSGHTSTAFFVAAYLHRFLPEKTGRFRHGFEQALLDGSLFAYAVYTAYSRIQIDKHYFSDVVGGAAVGVAAAYLAFHWFYPANGGQTQRAEILPLPPGRIFIQIQL